MILIFHSSDLSCFFVLPVVSLYILLLLTNHLSFLLVKKKSKGNINCFICLPIGFVPRASFKDPRFFVIDVFHDKMSSFSWNLFSGYT